MDLPRCNVDDEAENDRSLTASDTKTRSLKQTLPHMYRIKSPLEEHERVVRESLLVKSQGSSVRVGQFLCGHADRAGPLYDYCVGLMLPGWG